MPPLSPSEIELLRAVYYDTALRFHEGQILAVLSNVGFRGMDSIKAFRSLRVRSYLAWKGHSVVGGELYELTPEGRKAYEEVNPPKK